MKISYGLRAFGIYFLILGSLIWFTLDNAIERLNDGMRQSAESVLVDMAHLVASFIEDELQQPEVAAPTILSSTQQLSRVSSATSLRAFEAQIYQVVKNSVDTQIYVTDKNGIVVYDSTGRNTGDDFSGWRDVRLTLQGEYGARTSFVDKRFTQPDDLKVMVVAAPIRINKNVLGVVSVAKPIASLEGHLLTETKQLQQYAFVLVALALLLGYLLSLWFTNSLKKIATYANNMADGRQVQPPVLRDTRLAELTDSISNLRLQLDGKEYVENYIHGLTHELKTPITSIRGAVELMGEDMSNEDRTRFLNNISTSNQRMSRLVERMLSLAKLEGLTELVATEKFNLVPSVNHLLQERSSFIDANTLKLEMSPKDTFDCHGDRVLIAQAIANLIDNAIGFCVPGGLIKISLETDSNNYRVHLYNQGDPIPDFALTKLYDRFFSLPRPNVIDSASKSTGLGLSFVQEIMKLHHGNVKIRNVAGGVEAILSWPTNP